MLDQRTGHYVLQICWCIFGWTKHQKFGHKCDTSFRKFKYNETPKIVSKRLNGHYFRNYEQFMKNSDFKLDFEQMHKNQKKLIILLDISRRYLKKKGNSKNGAKTSQRQFKELWAIQVKSDYLLNFWIQKMKNWTKNATAPENQKNVLLEEVMTIFKKMGLKKIDQGCLYI